MSTQRNGSGPARVAVVGAGMVGLSTAWFLQERGVDVTVLDRRGVAAGSSWGNAGWLTPGISTPLPDPAVLKYGIRAALSPASPVYVPPTLDHRLLRFLARFTRNSTMPRWRRAMDALVPINRLALESFDLLAEGGVDAPTHETESFVAAYRTAAERTALLTELEHIREAGQAIAYDVLDGDEARLAQPLLSSEIGAALRLRGQRYINPATFTETLGAAVEARGGTLRLQTVTGIDELPDGVQVRIADDPDEAASFDAVVLATGTWLGALAREFGVRALVQAGRGYSFSVPVDQELRGPVYLPTQRVACTPLDGRLRVAGMMEFRSPDAPLDTRRVAAIVAAARPLLRSVDLDDRQDEWVGSRPCTADGLPLVGRTRSPHVYVAGGHGMWGVTLGPATGRLLAEAITTGTLPAALQAFDPLR
jgi:D-amino-acid dehydrogenase